jgi:XTP/dITP diphosphohydrolase
MTIVKKDLIVIASDNVHKAQELQNILERENIPNILQTDLQVKTVPETGLTFVENAILKARNACKQTSMPAIADDSGLEVKALSNKPGIYSARFAGLLANDTENVAKLLWELREAKEAERIARFQCIYGLLTIQHQLFVREPGRGKLLLLPRVKMALVMILFFGCQIIIVLRPSYHQK